MMMMMIMITMTLLFICYFKSETVSTVTYIKMKNEPFVRRKNKFGLTKKKKVKTHAFYVYFISEGNILT